MQPNKYAGKEVWVLETSICYSRRLVYNCGIEYHSH